MFALSRVVITQEPGISDFCQCRFIAGVINVRDVPSPTYLLRSSASPLFNCSARLADINCWRRTVTCSRVQASSSPLSKVPARALHSSAPHCRGIPVSPFRSAAQPHPRLLVWRVWSCLHDTFTALQRTYLYSAFCYLAASRRSAASSPFDMNNKSAAENSAATGSQAVDETQLKEAMQRLKLLHIKVRPNHGSALLISPRQEID